MVELVDTLASGASWLTPVQVRVLFRAPILKLITTLFIIPEKFAILSYHNFDAV